MPQRVVLTTWDPSAYFDLSGDEFILHLVAAALKSETVLLRDQDLSFNERIARIFIKAPPDSGRSLLHRRLVEELFDTHLFQVICMRHDEFHSQELAEMAAKQPIRARALYVRRNNLYVSPVGQPPFDPDEEPFKSFHGWIDPSVPIMMRHLPRP